jgi:hypothetical protein
VRRDSKAYKVVAGVIVLAAAVIVGWSVISELRKPAAKAGPKMPPPIQNVPPVLRTTNGPPAWQRERVRAVGQDAQKDFGPYQLRDVYGTVITGASFSYLPDPQPAFELVSSRMGSVNYSSRIPGPRRVLIKHEKFEAVVTAEALEGMSGEFAAVPVVLGEDEKKVGLMGQLVDEGGAPVAGAMVWLRAPAARELENRPPMCVRSDAQGRFCVAPCDVEEARPAVYWVAIMAEGLTGTVPKFVEAKAGEVLNVTLKKVRERALVVVDEKGEAVKTNDPENPIRVEYQALNSGHLCYTQLDGSGRVALGDGFYKLFMRHTPSGEGVSSQWVQVVGDYPASLVFDLTPREGDRYQHWPMLARVTMVDERKNRLVDVPFYFQDGKGQWVEYGRTDAKGEARFLAWHEGPLTVGVGLAGTPEKDARLRGVAPFQGGTEYAVETQIPYDARPELMRRLLATLRHVPVSDALGKAMPKGTVLTFDGEGKSVTLTVDGPEGIDAQKLAQVYRPPFTVSHPDYGLARVAHLAYPARSAGVAGGRGAGAGPVGVSLELPLVSQGDAGEKLVVTGQILDARGKPLAGVRVGAGLPVKSGESLRRLKEALVFGFTDANGEFRYRPVAGGALAEAMRAHVAKGAGLDFTAMPEDPWLMPLDGTAMPGAAVKAQLQKAEREITLEVVDVDGEAVPPLHLEMDLLDVAGAPVTRMPAGWLGSAGKIPLAYGTYVFKEKAKQYECIFEVSANGPAKVRLSPDSPPTATGTVVDMATGKGLANALILASEVFYDDANPGDLSAETWQKIAQMKGAIKVEELPADVRALCDIKKAAVTDEFGRFNLTPGDKFALGAIRLHVIKEGYAPILAFLGKPDESTGFYEIAPIQLPAAGYIELELPVLPEDIEPMYKGDPMCTLVYETDFKAQTGETPEGMDPVTGMVDLPNQLKLDRRRLVVPAGSKLEFNITRTRVGLTLTEGDYASFHLPEGPLTLKAGETRKVKMVRRKVLEPMFRVVGPDDKPLVNPALRCVVLGTWFRVNTFSHENGEFKVQCYEGMPLQLVMRHGKTPEESYFFNYPAFEKKPEKAITIKLTQEQLDAVNAGKVR